MVSVDSRHAQGFVMGDHATQNNFFGLMGPVVRSAYPEQVRRIAPKALYGREEELAELATFCTAGDSAPRYAWWRAPAWAGKSALMSWFVLHPPLGIRVVSFFITARYASQSDRIAFVDVVAEQLAELLEQPMPAYLTEATRDAHLLALLTDAAQTCQARGQRLVLLVDGLDEDRGVTIGPHAHSIAALLPAQPPNGMRIIGSGRPHPPIPTDVPDDHPLRNPEIVRVLDPSPHATVMRAAMEGELRNLLYGTGTEQDLLGLLTAAEGGLSSPDLAELTECPQWQIVDHLGAVAGRTFTTRTGLWQPNTEVYVLGHEQLRDTAIAYLRGAQLETYRQRLHTWADGYRARGWPAGTPEYLLRGYYRMLHSIGDMSRLVGCATDQARHDRMLDITGGDTAALIEITTAQDLILAQPAPDLLAMARLAIHRDALTARNANIPTGLPATWAILGQPTRAEALARSIPDPYWQAEALAAVVEVVAGNGDRVRAGLLVEQVEALARSVPDSRWQAEMRAVLVKAVAGSGDVARAEALARSVADPYWQAEASAVLVKAVAGSGDVVRAEALARSVADPYWRAEALAAVGVAVSGDDPVRAGVLAEQVEVLARSIPDPYWQARALVALVKAVAGSGDVVRAEALARSVADPYWQAEALAAVVEIVAGSGDLVRIGVFVGQVEELARSVADPYSQAQALTALARALAGSGDLVRARVFLEQAEVSARSVADPYSQAQALAALARALAGSGDLPRAGALAGEAESLARSIVNTYSQAQALVVVAEAVARSSDLGRVEALVEQVEELSRSVPDMYWHDEALVAVVEAAAGGGDLAQAEVFAEQVEELARSVPDTYSQARALAALARAVADSGDVARAEAVACSIPDPHWQAEALAAVTEVAAGRGDLVRAGSLVAQMEALVRSVDDSYSRARALASLVRALVGSGDLARAQAFAEQVETLAESVPDPRLRAEALVAAVEAVAYSGDIARAETVARAISHPYRQSEALVAVAGRTDSTHARHLLARAFRLGRWTVPLETLARIEPAVVTTLSAEFHAMA